MGFAGMRSWRKHQVRKALTEDWMRARVAGALSARVRKKRRRWTGSMAWRPPGVKSMSRRRATGVLEVGEEVVREVAEGRCLAHGSPLR